MLSPEPQLILDAVCTRVGNLISPMFVGWSIGQREAVVSTIAECLGMTDGEIDEAVAELIENDLLTNQPSIPDCYSSQVNENLGITHQGWQKWSGFDDLYVEDWGLDSLEAWSVSKRVPEDEHRHPEVFIGKPKAKAKTPHRTKIQPRSITKPWSPSQK